MRNSIAAPSFQTVDPASGKTLERYEVHTDREIDHRLAQAQSTFHLWSQSTIEERTTLLRRVADHLRANLTHIAAIATREMGKPIIEAEAEVLKCATVCEYYVQHGPKFLAVEGVETSATRSYVAYRPLGVILAVMPWNFPFWQVFRFAIPALVAGNVAVLKHAANVTECGLEIERIFASCGAPKGVFTTLIVPGREMEAIVADPRIAAVTLTGSESAGSSVASIAGKHLKKTVLELGGSDAFIVLADADLDSAARIAVRSRFQNCGQSCIAAKRFIVEASVHNAFLEAFTRYIRELRIGDPMDRTTTLGPLAKAEFRDDIERQVRLSIKSGARLVSGGTRIARAGFFFAPTILAEVREETPAFREETFGPVAAIIRARDAEHAVSLANSSRYGLGGNLWTRDVARGERIAARLESGAVFINGMTVSDPHLPFGGVKSSGYGRELSSFGLREFVNIQSVWIGPPRK
ncbi:MAG TPA: NAD-dependent succinate-semialdehyde dehydrogenase [Candidatus Baltobacteraceae bacterium]|jgi:succinate-semialdehyde dehydrogenase/glutarate-semialdehyde dehydrogenase|nr:NAD-dependent succinate-semialdehyde dehydrogenase [Candidatus Baltobacteraceae bacterium]